MGVTIHYRGKLADTGQIKTISDELVIVAEKMNWEWTSLDEDWDKPATATLVTEIADGSPIAQIEGQLPLKGVSLTPEGADSLSFFFDPEGNLCDPINLISIMDGTLKPEDAWVFTKTQFASPETHIQIVGLLKYLKKHHIPDLEVHDDGECSESERVNGKKCFLDERMNRTLNELSRFSGGHIFESSLERVDSMMTEMARELMGRPAQ